MTREEAIKTIRLTCPKISDSECDFETAMRFLIPELAESEDERMRNDIMEAVENWHSYERVEEIRAYLEKQKEQKPEERFEEAREKYQVEWGEEDIEKNLIAYLRYERKSTPQEIEEKFIPYIKRIKIMEQESVSPMSYGSLDVAMQEAGRRFDLPCTDKDKYSVADVFYAGVRAERESKQEWSEEEKMNIELLIALLRGKVNLIEILDSRKESIINFLKSLRLSWKPSEEQMEHLQRAINYYESNWGENKLLRSLINDLKKLM